MVAVTSPRRRSLKSWNSMMRKGFLRRTHWKKDTVKSRMRSSWMTCWRRKFLKYQTARNQLIMNNSK